jgi:hypothetical protein
MDGQFTSALLTQLCLRAPLAAADETNQMIHAVGLEQLIAGALREVDQDLVGACGAPVYALVGISFEAAMLWPPDTRLLPKGVKRCKACHKATGRMHPRATTYLPPRPERTINQ